MTIPFKLKAYGAALALVLAAFAYTYHTGAERATLTQRLHASDSTVAALRGRAKALDTVYRTDTLRLTAQRVKWRTLTDTVATWDTLRVPVPADTVRLIVATADTTIRACLLVVETCEQRVATRDTIIAQLRAQRPLLVGQRPGKVARWRNLGIAVGIGAIGGYFAHP